MHVSSLEHYPEAREIPRLESLKYKKTHNFHETHLNLSKSSNYRDWALGRGFACALVQWLHGVCDRHRVRACRCGKNWSWVIDAGSWGRGGGWGRA